MKMRGPVYAVIATLSLLTVTPGLSQELGSAPQGKELAQTVCAECHAVERGAIRSPFADAPTFESIAKTPGMSSMAIRVWLTRAAHREMPNLMLKQEEVDNVIAY